MHHRSSTKTCSQSKEMERANQLYQSQPQLARFPLATRMLRQFLSPRFERQSQVQKVAPNLLLFHLGEQEPIIRSSRPNYKQCPNKKSEKHSLQQTAKQKKARNVTTRWITTPPSSSPSSLKAASLVLSMTMSRLQPQRHLCL